MTSKNLGQTPQDQPSGTNPFSVERVSQDDSAGLRVRKHGRTDVIFVAPPTFFERVASKVVRVLSGRVKV